MAVKIRTEKKPAKDEDPQRAESAETEGEVPRNAASITRQVPESPRLIHWLMTLLLFPNISSDIPEDFQPHVLQFLDHWIFNVLLNVLQAITATMLYLLDQSTIDLFKSSCFFLVISPPWTYFSTFLPIHRAFRTGSSLDFCYFKFCMLNHCIFSLVCVVGFPGLHTFGIWNTIHVLREFDSLAVVFFSMILCQIEYLIKSYLMWKRADSYYHRRNPSSAYWMLRSELLGPRLTT